MWDMVQRKRGSVVVQTTAVQTHIAMTTSLALNDKVLAYHPQRFPSVLPELIGVSVSASNLVFESPSHTTVEKSHDPPNRSKLFFPKTCLHSPVTADINECLLICGFNYRQNSQLKEEGEPLERLNSSPYSTAMLGWLVRLPGW